MQNTKGYCILLAYMDYKHIQLEEWGPYDGLEFKVKFCPNVMFFMPNYAGNTHILMNISALE